MDTNAASNPSSGPDAATILVVEDDAATREFFVDLLDMAGYQSRVAASGADALAQVAQHPVQVVLLDQRLPDMDGLDLGRALRASMAATVPMILLTADH